MFERLGMHPDNPYPAGDMEEAMIFDREHVTCPHCGKTGGHSYDGHASLVRKTADGKIECFDAHCVVCGKCDATLAVFHTAYGTVATVGPTLAQDFVPGSGCELVTASGPPPQSWLPADIMAWGAKRPEPKEAGDVAGPVLIHSFESAKILPEGENGCGHSQFALLGPSIASILDKILDTREMMEAVRGGGKCGVCEQQRKGIILWIETALEPSAVNELVRSRRLPCRSYATKPETKAEVEESIGIMGDFSEELLKKARQEVVFVRYVR